MKISAFLSQQLELTLPEMTSVALDQLAGQEVRFTHFYPDFEAAAHRLLPWMPLYFFPIAREDMYLYGFHLTPGNRAAERLPIIQVGRNPISERVEATEIAPSLQRYLHRIMLEWEQNYEDEEYNVPPEERALEEEMSTSLPFLRQLFGDDFYTPGRREFYIHEEKYKEYYFDGIEEITIRHLGGTPHDYAEKLWPLGADELIEKQALAEEGCRIFPDWFVLHLKLAQINRKLDNPLAAAQSVRRALACYHYTAHRDDPQGAYDLGRELLNEVPDVFTPADREALAERSDVDRVKWIVSFVSQGNVERTVKLLDDLCFDWQQYETPYVLDFFKRLYTRLGWQWASALCDLRYPAESKSGRSFSMEQAEAWNKLVKQVIGLD